MHVDAGWGRNGRERARSLPRRPTGYKAGSRAPLAAGGLSALQKHGSSTRGECKGQELQIVNHSEVR